MSISLYTLSPSSPKKSDSAPTTVKNIRGNPLRFLAINNKIISRIKRNIRYTQEYSWIINNTKHKYDRHLEGIGNDSRARARALTHSLVKLQKRAPLQCLFLTICHRMERDEIGNRKLTIFTVVCVHCTQFVSADVWVCFVFSICTWISQRRARFRLWFPLAFPSLTPTVPLVAVGGRIANVFKICRTLILWQRDYACKIHRDISVKVVS